MFLSDFSIFSTGPEISVKSISVICGNGPSGKLNLLPYSGQKIACTKLIFGSKVSLPTSEGHATNIFDINDDSVGY
jgi:hypothetical protein